MRTARILITVLLLAAPVWVRAQAARPATGAPETFTATVQAKTATATASSTIEVRVSRYTPDFDRTTVETALRQGGYPRFLTALRGAPQVGELVLAGGQSYPIRYAREKIEAGARTIVVVTDKPVFFLGSGRAAPKPRAGYEIAVLQIQLDAVGRARGNMAAAARVRPDGDGGVLLDDYAEDPIALTSITRKPS